MEEKEPVGKQRIEALFRNMVFPSGTRLGTKSIGTKIHRTIQGEPGILTREDERAVRAMDDKVIIARWGPGNQNFYIYFE